MIEITSDAIERVGTLLADVPKGAERVFASAMNRGISRVKTQAIKQVKTVYAVNGAALTKATRINITKASTGNLAGFVSFSGVKIPLYKFKVTPTKPGTGKQVRAAVKKGGSGTPFEDAFVAEMKSNGHTGVFERTGRKRFPIEEKMGLSAAQMVGNEDIIDGLEKEAQELVTRTGSNEEKERTAAVYKMGLPEADDVQQKVPYILLKFLTGTDDKKAGEPEEDSCKVRIIFAVYSEDGQDGPLALLNLILRVRSELKKAGTIGGGQFALELPLEYIVYQDTTPPYYMGEMVTNWSMPVTQRDVAEILHNL